MAGCGTPTSPASERDGRLTGPFIMCVIATTERRPSNQSVGMAHSPLTQRGQKQSSCSAQSQAAPIHLPTRYLAKGFPAAIDRYLERKRTSLKPNSFRETERYLRDHSLPLHSLRLAQIDRRKVAALLGDIETGSGAATRNRARSALSAFFSWCIQEGLTDTNPVTGTGKASEGGSRERVLTQDELRKLWRNLGDDRFSDIVRLLLLTGARRTEIGMLQWSEVDLAHKMIVLAPARTKNGRQHELPLSTQALAILERQPHRNSSEFVFGERGFNVFGRAKQELDQRLHIAPWRLHDLRRTCATGMAELGVQPWYVEAVLNHQSGHKQGVAGTYNRAKYADDMRDALQRWADHVEAITR